MNKLLLSIRALLLFSGAIWAQNIRVTGRVTDRTGEATPGVYVWWNVVYVAGVDRYDQFTSRFSAPGSGISLMYQKGLLAENDRKFEYLSSNFMTTFHKQVSAFDFNLLLGTLAESTEINYDGRRAWNFVIPGFYTVTNVDKTDLTIAQSKTQKPKKEW